MERMFSNVDNFERDMGLLGLCLITLGWPVAGLAIGNKLNMISGIIGTQTFTGTFGAWIWLNIMGTIVAAFLIGIVAQPKNHYILPLTTPTGVFAILAGIIFGLKGNTLAVEAFSGLLCATGIVLTLASIIEYRRHKRTPQAKARSPRRVTTGLALVKHPLDKETPHA